MKELPEGMKQKVLAELDCAERAIKVSKDLIMRPKGRRDSTLEDALNEAQRATYQARGAFKPEAMR